MKRVFVVGGTGYVGRPTVRALIARGHEVVCLARRRAGVRGALDEDGVRLALSGAEVRFGEVTDLGSVRRDGFRGEPFDVVVSCLATRGGGIDDAWAVERDANLHVLRVAEAHGVDHFVLLSAICVQRPRLAFQHAKRAFEDALIEANLDHTVVRPTAFFKSLAGQVANVREGKPFVVFGDGRRTACKPIGEADLARFIADCVDDPERRNQVLPIGGPGPAVTPLDQGALLFRLTGQAPRYRHVPVALMDAIIGGLTTLGWVVPGARDKAELARIGRYYGTESMLVWDDGAQDYDEAATPSFGAETLEDFYRRVLRDGLDGQELGDHAVFRKAE